MVENILKNLYKGSEGAIKGILEEYGVAPEKQEEFLSKLDNEINIVIKNEQKQFQQQNLGMSFDECQKIANDQIELYKLKNKDNKPKGIIFTENEFMKLWDEISVDVLKHLFWDLGENGERIYTKQFTLKQKNEGFRKLIDELMYDTKLDSRILSFFQMKYIKKQYSNNKVTYMFDFNEKEYKLLEKIRREGIKN